MNMNIILACDSCDANLGVFFQKCADDLAQYIKTLPQYCLVRVEGNNLSRESIEAEISKLNGQPFIFLAYSHGEADRLCCDINCTNPYVKSPDNTYLFCRSLFYTFSCYTGRDLADALVTQNQPFSFMGYDDKAFGSTMPPTLGALVECVNMGIKSILMHKKPSEAFADMLNKYTDCLDKWLKKDHADAALFRRNRDALLFKGQNQPVSQL